MKLTVNTPSGGVWEFECEAVPRSGEHMNIHGTVYLVVEVQHVPQHNTVWVSVRYT